MKLSPWGWPKIFRTVSQRLTFLVRTSKPVMTCLVVSIHPPQRQWVCLLVRGRTLPGTHLHASHMSFGFVGVGQGFLYFSLDLHSSY